MTNFERAFTNGYYAYMEGKNINDNPYSDLRTQGGKVTYSRAFRREWIKGYEKAKGNKEKP